METPDKLPGKRRKRGGKNQRRKRESTDPASELPPKASLLGLPGELQNEIYRLLLVEAHSISVNANNKDQPPLLRTCKEIRKDALPISYEENTMAVEVADLRIDMPSHHWISTCCSHKPDASGPRLKVTSDVPRWKNLLLWLKRFHAREVPGVPHPRLQANESRDTAEPNRVEVIASAFGIVGCLMHLPWEEVEKLWESSGWRLHAKTIRGRGHEWTP
ncbi:hypothetical protein LTR85_008928 [Meristemomyces frigidus]|nr:hypothetical protein LTR85_008928 [Meristemomyces frigidus]